MVFLDRSGKRWRRIKLSGVSTAALGLAPVLFVLIVGLVYQPDWGKLQPRAEQQAPAQSNQDSKVYVPDEWTAPE